jgi:teichuronic acid biosynthesis glycosyltransferase TuaC
MAGTDSDPHPTASRDAFAGRRLRVLMVTGMYPTTRRPHFGTFVASQIESLRAAGLDIELVFPARGPALWRYPRGAAEVFFRTLLRRYDVVHAHYGLWGWAARAQWRAPVVMSFCGSDVLGGAREDGSITRLSWLVVLAGRLLARAVDAVVVKSQEMADRLPGVACEVIPNGVDFGRFAPRDKGAARASLGLAASRRYALFAANPNQPRKQYRLAARAVQLANTRVPEGLELLVVHDQSIDRVAEYMNAADVLLLTSLWEGSPNVVKEAMACELPVVSVPAGDVPEMIRHTEGCFLASRSADDLADKLVRAVSPPRRTTGRDDVAHLELGRVAERIVAVYDRVSGGRGGNRQLSRSAAGT